jgi:uncharacterized membrane protein YeaQ/YmgE (transglycosylase-associated protein family)
MTPRQGHPPQDTHPRASGPLRLAPHLTAPREDAGSRTCRSDRAVGRPRRDTAPTTDPEGRDQRVRLLYAAVMLIIGIILLGMIAGAGAQLVLQRGSGITWPMALATGVIGSFVGGLFFSLLAGDGLDLKPSGIIGSIFGAVTLLWDWVRGRSAPERDEPSRPHV